MNYARIYFRKKRAHLERITDFKVLFGSLFVVSVIILSIFILTLSCSTLNDPRVLLVPLEQSVLQNKAKQVQVGLAVNTFEEFEMIQNDFIMDGTIWFKFNKQQIDASLIDKFSFENAIVIHKSPPYKKNGPNNTTLIFYDIRLKFRGNLNYQYYPFDSHRLDFILVNKASEIDQLVYIADDKNLTMKKSAFTKDWVKTGQSTAYGTRESEVFSNGAIQSESVLFSFDFERSSLKSIYLIFVPFFLIFFVGLLSLTFSVRSQFKVVLTLNLGSITALIFLSSTLAQMSPVSGIFTLADMIYILLLIIITATLTLQIGAMHALNKKQSETKLQEVIDHAAMVLNIIRSLFFLFFLFVMLLMVAWLMLL